MRDSERLQKQADEIRKAGEDVRVKAELQIGAALASALYEIAAQIAAKNELEKFGSRS
jgi:hypothetical protein